MSFENRCKYIMTVALRDGAVSIPETAQYFGVSIETIRRDVNMLCAENKLRKVHGGAVPVKRALRRDPDYLSRITKNQQAKMAIGAYAAKLIHDGDIVMLDCGVSIQAIALSLTNLQDVTFITNSVPTATILLDKCAVGDIFGRIIIVGGEMNNLNRFSSGSAALESISLYYADKAFISCTAVSAESVSNYDVDECHYSARLLHRSTLSILIAESDKFGKNSVYSLASPSEFSKIITDSETELPEDFTQVISASQTELIIV